MYRLGLTKKCIYNSRFSAVQAYFIISGFSNIHQLISLQLQLVNLYAPEHIKSLQSIERTPLPVSEPKQNILSR